MIEFDLKNRLPQPTGQPGTGESPEISNGTARKYGILVADDEGGVRRVLYAGLRRRGFDVWLAADGQEALELYWRHREMIDLVLLDVCMPGLDGPQAVSALQQLQPQIRFCFMSGDFGDYTEETLRDLGAAAVLRKPFQLAEAVQMLWELATMDDLSLATF